MTHTLPPYPHTKPSGIDWLGDVPEHWQVRRLKTVASNVNEQTSEKQPGERYIALENVESWTGKLHLSKSEIEFDSQVKRFKKGDILFGKLRPYLAKVVQPQVDGVCVGEFFVLRAETRMLNSSYLENLLRSKPVIDEIDSSTFGAKMPRANWTFVGGVNIPLPPPAEQAAIVRYLDDADARIRRVIRAREKQLALLTEYKQALIERVVTGQIDVRHCAGDRWDGTGDRPVAPTRYPHYRPSGIEWLGDVPAHWEVRRLGSLGKLSKGNGGTKADNVLTGVPCIRYGELYTKYRFFVETAHSFISPERASDYTSIEYGDVLFAGSGETIEEIGKSAVNLIRGKAVCGGDVLVFKPSERFVPRFLGYVSDCPQSVAQKSSMGRGFTVVHIYGDKLKNLWIAIPPIAEQEAIVRYLDAQTGKIERATAAIRREIDLLKEYRTRLIADVVTGKIDVRAMM